MLIQDVVLPSRDTVQSFRKSGLIFGISGASRRSADNFRVLSRQAGDSSALQMFFSLYQVQSEGASGPTVGPTVDRGREQLFVAIYGSVGYEDEEDPTRKRRRGFVTMDKIR